MLSVADVLAMAHNSEIMSGGWKLDSGATQHICHDITQFSGVFSSYGAPKALQVGKAEVYLLALGEGTILLQVPSGPAASGGGVLSPYTLTKAWFCPECPFNLISVRRVVEDGSKVTLSSQGAAITDSGGEAVAWMELDRFGLYTCQGSAGAAGAAGADGAAGAVAEDRPADMCRSLFFYSKFQ